MRGVRKVMTTRLKERNETEKRTENPKRNNDEQVVQPSPHPAVVETRRMIKVMKEDQDAH
jgi:hypothetical protein